MACEAPNGCSTIVHTDNRPPGATDDPCNNSGLGYFCQRSFFIYDPTLPGADTVTNGTCPRMWLRTGDDCNVSQWIEVCLKDQVNHLLLNAVPNFVQVDIPDGTIQGTVTNMDNVVIPVINNGCEPMDVCIRARLWATIANYEINPGYLMTHDFRMTVDFGGGPVFSHVVSAINTFSTPTVIEAHSNNDGEIEHCFVLPAGNTQNVTFNVDYVCNGAGPCASASYFGFGYTIEGHTQ